jgi:hypothetical protein
MWWIENQVNELCTGALTVVALAITIASIHGRIKTM